MREREITFRRSPSPENAAITVATWTRVGNFAIRNYDRSHPEMPAVYYSGIAAAGMPKGALPVLTAKERYFGTSPQQGFRSYESMIDMCYSRITPAARQAEITKQQATDREYLQQLGMRKRPGLSLEELDLLKISRSQDIVIARPKSGLMLAADGAGGHGDGDVASRFVAKRFAYNYEHPDPELLQRAPRDLRTKAAKSLWVAARVTDAELWSEKNAGRIAKDAASTLTGVALHEDGYTAFNAGDSGTLYTTPTGGRALTSEQSGGDYNSELYNAFMGTVDGRRYSTSRTGRNQNDAGADEIIDYPWELEDGEPAAFVLYTDGIKGDAKIESRTSRQIGEYVGSRMLTAEFSDIAVGVVADLGIKWDDRGVLIAGVAASRN